MTALELTQHTAQMLGFDGAADLDDAPRALIRRYLDEAVAQAALERMLPQADEVVTLDGTGCIAEAALAHEPEKILDVEIDNVRRPFRRIRLLAAAVIQVPGGADQTARITYGYRPAPLADQEEPPFPTWFHPHLADYAAARMMGQTPAGQAQARFLTESWYNALGRLSGSTGQSWKHLYRR